MCTQLEQSSRSVKKERHKWEKKVHVFVVHFLKLSLSKYQSLMTETLTEDSLAPEPSVSASVCALLHPLMVFNGSRPSFLRSS